MFKIRTSTRSHSHIIGTNDYNERLKNSGALVSIGKVMDEEIFILDVGSAFLERDNDATGDKIRTIVYANESEGK